MSQGLRELTSHELNAALESVLLPRLADVLAARGLGHCMRVTDLDRDLMIRLAGGLRARVPSANVVVLADEALRAQARERWHQAQLQVNATLGEQRVAALHALIQESLTLLADAGEETPHG